MFSPTRKQCILVQECKKRQILPNGNFWRFRLLGLSPGPIDRPEGAATRSVNASKNIIDAGMRCPHLGATNPFVVGIYRSGFDEVGIYALID